MTHAAFLNDMQIMPRVWARFDRIWYGHPGKLFGTKTSQPLLVPLDHVFEVRSFQYCSFLETISWQIGKYVL